MASLLRSAAALQYKLLDAIRHPCAFIVAHYEGAATDFSGFGGARQCLLVTFKRSGDPVPSPVNFGLSEDGKLYCRCEPDVAKLRRIRRDPHVRVCPCNFRGKPTGVLVEATARILSDAEAKRAHAVIAANYDPTSRVFEWRVDRLGIGLVYLEVTRLA